MKGDAFWLVFEDNFELMNELKDVKRVKRVELRPKQRQVDK